MFTVNKKTHGLIIILLFFWFSGVMHIFWPNMGGVGLNLPLNMMCWAMIAIVVFVYWISSSSEKTIITTPLSKLLAMATGILLIPIFYTRPEWYASAGLRLAGLVGGLIFYFTLLQCRFSQQQRQFLLYTLLLAVFLESLLSLLQLFSPEFSNNWMPFPITNGRPYAIFQQVNILSTFIATGLALTLMFYLLPNFAWLDTRYERVRFYALSILLFIFPMLLILTQSRVGYLTGAVIVIFYIMIYGSQRLKRSVGAILLMACGALSAYGLMLYSGELINHTMSNSARSIMLKDTLAMVLEKPLAGWGYGGFEFSFQHFRLSHLQSTMGVGIVIHPHNELLFWWAEGGVVALGGMILLIVAGLGVIRSAYRSDQKKNGRMAEGIALCLLMLPIIIHTQTEYPFYLSAVHWAIFLLLLALVDSLVNTSLPQDNCTSSRHYLLRVTFSILAIGTICLMITGLLSGQALTRAEKAGLTDLAEAKERMHINPWMLSERWQFDWQVHNLLVFNQTGDPRLLNEYARWAEDYLTRHVDRNVYATLVAILEQQKKNIQYTQCVNHHAAIFFPDDVRFKPLQDINSFSLYCHNDR